MKYRIAISENETREVEGEPVEFPGFQEFQFFFHPCFDVPGFVVSEASTGFHLVQGRTRVAAIEESWLRLSEIGAEKFKRTVSRARKGS